MQSSAAIEVHDLRISYGSFDAVAGIDLVVQRGETFAFLGPNGAGKTSTVETLEGFRNRTGGDVCVLGVDPARADSAWRARVGVVLQESEPEPELTVGECLALYASYYATSRPVQATLEMVGLWDAVGRRCGQLSGGQRRRLDLALALIGDPELLFLDEPTTGFDPSARRAAWMAISRLRDLGKTIFLTTHYLEEAERLADRIAIIAKGRIVSEGTVETLGDRALKPSTVRFTLPPHLSVTDLPPALRLLFTEGDGGRAEATTTSPLDVLGILAAWARERGVDLPDLEVVRPTLEDIYLDLTEECR